MKKRPASVSDAIAMLRAEEPLGDVIRLLRDIQTKSIIEAYRAGCSLRECGAMYGMSFSQVADIIRKRTPYDMRPSGFYGQRRNREGATQ